LCRDGIKPEPVRFKAEIRSLPQASHYVAGLHNSSLSHILSCLFIGSGDVASHKHNRQSLLSPFALAILNFFVLIKAYT